MKNLFILLILFYCITSYGQRHSFIDVVYSEGKTLPSNDFVAGDNLAMTKIDKYGSLQLKFGLQTIGSKNWSKIYHQPTFGLGVSINDFSSSELGKPISTFGFLGIPVFRFKGVELMSEIQYGLATGWKFYNPLTNSKNHAIGSLITVHVALHTMLKIHLGPYLDLTGSVGFVHFSNGRFERPNNGINILTPSVGLSYLINKRAPVNKPFEKVKLPKNHDIAIMVGHGSHQRTERVDDRNYFSIAGLSVNYGLQHNNYYRSRVGLDLNYFWSLTVHEDGSQAPVGFDNITAGLVYQPEFFIGRFTLFGGIGVYARHIELGNFKSLYQRLGLRYNITDYLSIAYNIRSVKFYQAEFLEAQIGYHF